MTVTPSLVVPAAGTVPWRRRRRPPRGRDGPPAQVRRLVLGQGQARPRGGVAGRGGPRDGRGDRTRRPPRHAAPAGQLHRARPHRRPRDEAGPLLGGRGRRRKGQAPQRDRRGGLARRPHRARQARLRPRPRPAAGGRPRRRRRPADHLAARRRPARQGRGRAARGRPRTPNVPSTSAARPRRRPSCRCSPPSA